MEQKNKTSIFEFILLGLSERPDQQRLLLGLFLIMYLITVVGNLLIILAISSDPHLQSPMYFFLANLSFADICFVSASIPKMLVNIESQHQTISYVGCITQLYFLLTFGGLDNLLLAAMAYDRYVAICRPLHYATVMSPQHCALMLTVCWTLTNIPALTHCILLAHLEFCTHHAIPYFYCDISPLLKLACSDAHLNELMVIILGAIFLIVPLALIVLSYAHITSAILGFSSPEGRWKAFSTCGSHLTVVLLFYGSLMGVYLFPSSSYSVQRKSAAAVLYMVVTPMMNPFIYSLRNKDMKGALGRLFGNGKTLSSP
ncbi:olfactory receptor 1N2-like [Trichosurus vulpecula]|uniref:olfactory receptor 1N2-like n=1 Tax=Trichosurus vulpecula TaxID=9337 RepID=UPI00186ABE9A|nr:olfactory receptor 1N2-like [Trichosurus vulpecula]